jgi:hypothetical protein
MKGIVFSEFIELVESVFGDEMLDDIIDDCSDNLSSGGAYTSVGTYEHEELVSLVIALSTRSGIPVPDLVKTFGLHLAKVFAAKFPSFFAECDNCFDFYKRVDDHIHVEVLKLYPDAELPKFTFDDATPNTLHLTYESTRQFSDLALGLLQGVALHYNDDVSVAVKDESTPDKTKMIFTITK